MNLNIRAIDVARVRQLCASVASQGGNSMARKVGQIIARGDRRWLIRVYLGRDRETQKRKYHNRTIHGSMREAQTYLTRKLRERDLGRDLEAAKITLNEYLDRWLETGVRARVRPKTFQDYQGILHRYVRPVLGERGLAALRPLDRQTVSVVRSIRRLNGKSRWQPECHPKLFLSNLDTRARPSRFLRILRQTVERYCS